MRTGSRIPAHVRRQVANGAKSRCEYCLSPEEYSIDSFTIDHVDPGGGDDPANLAFACHNCNNRKQDDRYAPDPLTGEPVPLYDPRRSTWSDHFAWSPDGLAILALTPTGRATVARLRLNRPGAVNIRRALLLLGEHPGR